MAYDTYDNLKIAVLDQTHRSNLGTKFDDFLHITEVEIRSSAEGSLMMSLSEAEQVTVASTSVRTLALPTGFQSSRQFTITIDSDIYGLEFRTPTQMTIRRGTGTPCFFTIRNNLIEFDILPDVAYTITITYMSEVTPLSASNQTNIVLTKYPNIYLFGCLKQAAIYDEDLQQSTINDGLFSEAINAANNAEHNIKYPTQPQETVGWAP